MKLIKNIMPIALVAFTAITIASAAPTSATTVSVELMKAWPKWHHLQFPRDQILYALVRNTGTEPLEVRVLFEVSSAGQPTQEFWTDIALLPPHPRPKKLETIFPTPMPGVYVGVAKLYYRAVGGDWLIDGRKSFDFKVVG